MIAATPARTRSTRPTMKRHRLRHKGHNLRPAPGVLCSPWARGNDSARLTAALAHCQSFLNHCQGAPALAFLSPDMAQPTSPFDDGRHVPGGSSCRPGCDRRVPDGAHDAPGSERLPSPTSVSDVVTAAQPVDDHLARFPPVASSMKRGGVIGLSRRSPCRRSGPRSSIIGATCAMPSRSTPHG